MLQGLDVVQHSVGSNEVDGEAQGRPPRHHNGEDTQPDGHLHNQRLQRGSKDYLRCLVGIAHIIEQSLVVVSVMLSEETRLRSQKTVGMH